MVNKDKVNLVLETLSFFEPMSLEKIILDFDKTKIEKMKDFTTYLSTAPVVAILSLTAVAGVLIEINRFFPDALIVAF